MIKEIIENIKDIQKCEKIEKELKKLYEFGKKNIFQTPNTNYSTNQEKFEKDVIKLLNKFSPCIERLLKNTEEWIELAKGKYDLNINIESMKKTRDKILNAKKLIKELPELSGFEFFKSFSTILKNILII